MCTGAEEEKELIQKVLNNRIKLIEQAIEEYCAIRGLTKGQIKKKGKHYSCRGTEYIYYEDDLVVGFVQPNFNIWNYEMVINCTYRKFDKEKLLEKEEWIKLNFNKVPEDIFSGKYEFYRETGDLREHLGMDYSPSDLTAWMCGTASNGDLLYYRKHKTKEDFIQEKWDNWTNLKKLGPDPESFRAGFQAGEEWVNRNV